MKIFYWLHRRLHTNLEYCRVPQSNKGHAGVYVDDGSTIDLGVNKRGTDKDALLLDPNVACLQHVLDGILTIGTLGHLDGRCHLQGSSLVAAADVPQEFPPSDTAAFKEEGGESLPLELAPPAEHPNLRLPIESFRKEMAPMEDVKSNNGRQVESIADEEEDLLEPLLGEIVQVDKKERVTLADLLAAEHLHGEKADPTGHAASDAAKTALEKAVNGATKATVMASSLSCSTKHSQALNKKLVPWKKGSEYPPPANGKLHQRLRRMLKKKIHPEMAQARGGGDGGSYEKSADLEPVSQI